MSAREIVKTFMAALQSGNMEAVGEQMADEFVGSGLASQPLDKETFLAMQSELCDAMPDLSYNLTIYTTRPIKLMPLFIL